MTTFTDGPIHGKTLMLRRAPAFLRATDDGTKVDALDQLDDTPLLIERLYAYVITSPPGHIHLNTGRRPGGGFYPMANYKFIDPQPPDEVMRSNKLWSDWCEAPSNPHVPDFIRKK